MDLMRSWVDIKGGREGRKQCTLCDDDCKSVSHDLWGVQ